MYDNVSFKPPTLKELRQTKKNTRNVNVAYREFSQDDARKILKLELAAPCDKFLPAKRAKSPPKNPPMK